MRAVKDRHELSEIVNFRKMPVVRIDLAEIDDYGLKGAKVLIDTGKKFSNSSDPFMVRADLRVYDDQQKWVFHNYGCMISADKGYEDYEEDLAYNSAPVIKADQDVLLFIVNSKLQKVLLAQILHTSKSVDPHSQSPIRFIDEDNDAYPYLFVAYNDSDMIVEEIKRRLRF